MIILQYNIVNLIGGVVLFALVDISIQDGYPYDGMYFIESGKSERRKLHQGGWDTGYRSYVARLTVEDGAQIPGTYAPDYTGSHIYFAYGGGMRYIRDHREFKVEFLQHTTNGGITWIYTHKQWKDDHKHNLSMVIGKLATGEPVSVCRAFPVNNDLSVMIGRHVRGQDGCIVHYKNKEHRLDNFEVMGISYLGMKEGGKKRYWGSTQDYCDSTNQYCIIK